MVLEIACFVYLSRHMGQHIMRILARISTARGEIELVLFLNRVKFKFELCHQGHSRNDKLPILSMWLGQQKSYNISIIVIRCGYIRFISYCVCPFNHCIWCAPAIIHVRLSFDIQRARAHSFEENDIHRQHYTAFHFWKSYYQFTWVY